MKKLLLFIAAAVFAASAAVAQEVPQVEPVENGITIVVHIPDGSDCYGAPLWCGDNNNWSGEEMQAIDGYPNWYKLDVPGVSSLQGRALANFEGWENGLGDGWPTQYYDYEVLQEYTTADWYGSDNGNLLSISWQGIVYIDVKSWMYNPCISSREFKFTIVVPECTPEGQETVNIVGAFPDAEGNTWAKGIDFPIVEGKAEITITGQETIEWKVRLTDDWSQQAVECRNGRIWEWNNQVLGEAEGQVIVVEGWGGAGHAIGDCFSDCKPLILSTNNFILYPGESVKVSLEYKDSPVDATAAVWISNDPEVFTIDETGLITGVATGQGTFTVTYNDLSATGYVKVLDEALLDIPVPDIDPVPGGITVAVHIPDGTDCYGAPLWGGDTNPSPWSGEEMVAVEGAEGWYKVDINATYAEGKPLAHPEGWTPEQGLGDWPTQFNDYEIMSKSAVTYEIVGFDDIVLSGTGILYIWVNTWKDNPCVPDRNFTFYIQVPECTPAGQETVNVVGSFPDADGNTWSKGTDFPIVDGKATITINGKETDGWKVRLTDDWSQQAVECLDGEVYEWSNQTLGEAEGQVIVVEGWGVQGEAFGDCLSDCVLPEYEVTFGLPDCTPRDAEIYIEGELAEIDWDRMTVSATVQATLSSRLDVEMRIEGDYGYLFGYGIEHCELYEREYSYFEEKYYMATSYNPTVEECLDIYYIEGWDGMDGCECDCKTLELKRVSGYVPYMYTEEGDGVYAAYIGDENVSYLADWSSSNPMVAAVRNGIITPLSAGDAIITCSYGEQNRILYVTVNEGPWVNPRLELLNGSDYYIFQMDETTFNELDQAGKVTSDMRINGVFEGEVLVPEDATRVNYVWNPAAEEADAPQFGVNSFGKAEGWFSIAAASPTPDGCWGNICGGLGIATETDLEVGKLQNLTPDHVLVVVLKGSYTPMESLEISMTPPVGGDQVQLFKVTDATGEYNDGDWEVFTLTYHDLIYMGIDLSQPITTDFWYPWAYVANGAGNRVDVDCVFFYVPGEMSAIDETGASSGKISVSASKGRIYCDEPFRVINLAGQDVTSLNGNLQGTYIVVSGDKAVKVVVD